MKIPSFDPGGFIFAEKLIILTVFSELFTSITPTKSTRLKRGLEHLDIDIDQKLDHHYISLAGIEFNTTHDEYSRAFLHVRHMLVSIACYEYAKSSDKNCPYNQMRYFKALRNYGCNCFPENFDSINLFTGSVLWVLGQNGHGVDDVDLACQNGYHRYHCYEMDGCFKGTAYNYFLDENGGIQCGTQNDKDYASNPELFKCQLASCQIERTLAETLYPLIGWPKTFEKINAGNYRGWENEQLCVTKEHLDREAGGPNRKTQCCGGYPRRRSYNPDKYNCCDDGKVRPQGFC